MANIYEVAQGFRRALLRRERSAAVELVQAYGVAYDHLSGQLDKLLKKIEAAKAAGETVDQAWLLREQRYFALINQVLREIGRFADRTGAVITDQQREAVRQAMADSERLLVVASEAAPEGVSGEFNRINKDAVENMVGFLSDGSPLKSLLDELPREAAAKVGRELADGIIRGRGPRAVAREIRSDLNGSLVRALRIARTETLRAYRETSHQSYQRNPELLDGWIWLSSLQSRCCVACIALHGTFHPLSERMKSHVSCRCTQVPAVKGVDLGIEKGSDWFAKQSAKVQREIFNQESKYEAYRSGELTLEEFVGLRRNAQWGDSYEVLGLKRAQIGEGQFPAEPKRPRDLPALIVPREEPGPRGTPVSRAITVPRSGEVAAAARRVLGIIDRLHGDGELPEIPIRSSPHRQSEGRYSYFTQTGKPLDIAIGQHGEEKEVATAHEIGHFLDHKGIGREGNYGNGEALGEFRKAVARSNAVQNLLDYFKSNVHQIKDPDGREITYTSDREFIRYLLDNKELWARAYSQWVAVRSGDQVMLDQIRKVREDPYPSNAASHWADDDFEPIASAIDDLMVKMGWRK